MLNFHHAQFEDFNVQCDKCDFWFHFVCEGLSGKEKEVQPGSEFPYFCKKCKVLKVEFGSFDMVFSMGRLELAAAGSVCSASGGVERCSLSSILYLFLI